MKWIKLYEEFSKKNKLILLDGSSSSGKTTTTQKLGAKSFLKATKKDKIVVIGSDDFSNFENRIPYDHEGKVMIKKQVKLGTKQCQIKEKMMIRNFKKEVLLL